MRISSSRLHRTIAACATATLLTSCFRAAKEEAPAASISQSSVPETSSEARDEVAEATGADRGAVTKDFDAKAESPKDDAAPPPPPKPSPVKKVAPSGLGAQAGISGDYRYQDAPASAGAGRATEESARRAAKGKRSSLQASEKYAAEPSMEANMDLEEGGGSFQGREAKINRPTMVVEDALSTFAIDVDTAAYSIARRTLMASQMPTQSLVRVEELINYFRYDYDAPSGDRHPFAIQADGARSPVDASKHMLRVGIQSRIVEDGQRLPSNLVFLFDTSCSMTSGDKLELAKTSLKIAVDQLTEKDQVAITTYAGGVQVVLPPTRADQKAKIKRAIDSLSPGGGTAMASGLTLAYKQAAAMLRDGTNTRIIVCSDGDANIGASSGEDMLKQVEGYVKEGVRLSTIGFGDGNYKDATMETIANRGNGNYFYIDTKRQAERVFGRDLTKMLQDVAEDVKIQVEFEKASVVSYRLVGYENRDVADADFRNDRVDAGEIGAGHQVTALYELTLAPGAEGKLGTIRVRAKEPRGSKAKEVALDVPLAMVARSFEGAPEDLRFATAVMGGAELLRNSPHAEGWNYGRVLSILSDVAGNDADRREFRDLMQRAARLSGEQPAISAR